jgi:NAD+ kinase
MSAPRVLVLSKRTSYRTMVIEAADAHIQGLLARGDPTVRRMRRSHEDHESTREEVQAALSALGVGAEFVEGARTRVEGEFDLVVTIGGDGTLLAASHRIGPSVPLLGVNSAPDHSVGFFCAAKKGSVRQALAGALDGTIKGTVLTRMRVDLNDRCLHKRVLNDALFCHEVPAATSRYILRVCPAGADSLDRTVASAGKPRGDHPLEEEEQRSSGVWVGPAAGSTAAQRSAGGRILPLSSRKIQYVVREPYTPLGARLALSRGTVSETGALVLLNKMRHARIFLDGHDIVHKATVGDVITMKRSDETLTVLGLARQSSKSGRPNA